MHTILKHQPRTVEELAQHYRVNQRTIYRDLRSLEQAGVALAPIDGKYSVEPDTFLPPLALTEGELTALWLGARKLASEAFGEELQSAVDKLKSAVQTRRRKALNELEGALAVASQATCVDKDLLQTILDSIRLNRRILLTYSSLQHPEPRARKVDPWGVFNRESAWYLVGFDHHRQDRRTFKLQRVSAFAPTGETFQPPPQFAPEEAMFHNFDVGEAEPAHVQLEVGPELRRHLEQHPAHPSQRLNGSRASYRVKAPLRMVRWILGLGQAQVLEPLELRQAVAREAARLAQLHARGTVVAVSCSPEHTLRKPNQEAIRVLAGQGVEGDAHRGETVKHRSRVERDPSQPNLRQVHLIHAELHDELRQAGFAVQPGEMGENVTTRGLDLLGLPVDTRLYFGDTAVLRVTGLRNPCRQLEGIQEGLMAATLERAPSGQLIRKAGIMAVVEHEGTIRPGDSITVEMPRQPHQPLQPV